MSTGSANSSLGMIHLSNSSGYSGRASRAAVSTMKRFLLTQVEDVAFVFHCLRHASVMRRSRDACGGEQ